MFLLLIGEFEIPLVGVPEGLTGRPSQLGIGECHQRATVLFFDAHDTFQGMLGFLPRFDVTDELHNLVFVPGEKFPRQSQKSGRAFVVDPMTGGTQHLVRAAGHLGPLPPATAVNRSAFRANRWLRQFLPYFVGIVFMLAEQTILPIFVVQLRGLGHDDVSFIGFIS
jgi:hypothetical protein